MGVPETASEPGRVALEGELPGSPRGEFGAVPETGALLPAEWARECVVTTPPGDTVRVGSVELASTPGWAAVGAVVAGSRGEWAPVGEAVLASATEPVASEDIRPDTRGGAVVFGRPEVASAPGLVAVDRALPDSAWGEFGVVLASGVPVPAGWTDEAVAVASPGEKVTRGAAELGSVPASVNAEAAVSGLCGE